MVKTPLTFGQTVNYLNVSFIESLSIELAASVENILDLFTSTVHCFEKLHVSNLSMNWHVIQILYSMEWDIVLGKRMT